MFTFYERTRGSMKSIKPNLLRHNITFIVMPSQCYAMMWIKLGRVLG
jgi:hypothetical protein